MCSYRSWLPRLPSFFARENFYPKFALFLVALQLLNALSNSQLVVPSLQGSPAQSSPSNESSSSNALKEYVIYSVVDGPSPDDDNEKVRLHLAMLLAPADVQEYGGGYTGVDFWHVKMSDMQRTAFASANPKPQIHENRQFLYHEDLIRWGQNLDQNVSHPEMSLYATRSEVSIDSDSSTARTVYQSDAPPDLKVVSWAPNVPFSKSKSYAYDPAGGGESSVYVIENGIVGFNREFFWPPPEWRFGPSVRRTETDDDPSSHGSCVASKAIGAQNGVSKTSQLVVMKSSLSLVDIAWAFQQIVNDVAKLRSGRVVVLLAATTTEAWRPEAFQDARFSRLYLRMKNLIELGAVVVVPAGDYGQRSFFADTVPAVFASPSKIPGRQALPLLVAGTVDNQGAEALWSQNTLTDGMVWAPGVKVSCTKKGWSPRSTETGTSISAGMVAGLAAYFLGMKTPPFTVGGPGTSRNLIRYIETSASWARLPGKRKVIWNRLDGSLYGSQDNDLLYAGNASAAVVDA